jgi:hypothetical protein
MNVETLPVWSGACVVEDVSVTFREDGRREILLVVRGGGREGLAEWFLLAKAAMVEKEDRERKEGRP